MFQICTQSCYGLHNIVLLNLLTTSGLLNSFHGFISLPNATSYDKSLYFTEIMEVYVLSRSKDRNMYCHDAALILRKLRKRAKIGNRYNQAPHLTQDTNGKVKTSQLDSRNKSQEVSPFPAGDHKASINRQARKHNKKSQK